MRHTEQTSGFRHDVKRESRGMYRSLLTKGGEVDKVVRMLANNIPLPPKYRDHPLHGKHEGSRDCHIRPDFVLIYRLVGDDVLVLERLASHADLFGM